MILITPDEGPTGLTSSIDAMREQLSDMRLELQAIYKRIKSGELGEIGTLSRDTGEIRRWLRIALEAEIQLEKRNKTKKGIAYDYAIDFDAARASVRSRMDRIAGRGGTAEISAESE